MCPKKAIFIRKNINLLKTTLIRNSLNMSDPKSREQRFLNTAHRLFCALEVYLNLRKYEYKG